MSTLGKRIKEERNAKNLTQEELGKICGMTKYTISLYESGKSTPNDEVKKILADYFNVSIDYLLGHSNIRNPYIENSLDEAEPNYIKKDSENLPENKNESSEPKLATTEMVIDKLIKAGLLKDGKIDADIANMLLNSLKIDIELKLKEEEREKGSS